MRWHGPGGTQESLMQGRSAPRSNPLTFYIPFFTEKVPFVYRLLLTNGTPFHIPSLELCIPFTAVTAVNALAFKYEYITKQNHHHQNRPSWGVPPPPPRWHGSLMGVRWFTAFSISNYSSHNINTKWENVSNIVTSLFSILTQITPRDTRHQIFLPHDLTDFFHPPPPPLLPTHPDTQAASRIWHTARNLNIKGR